MRYGTGISIDNAPDLVSIIVGAPPFTSGEATHAFFARLASASGITVAESFDESVVSADTAVQVITPSAIAYLPMSDLIDFEKEKARLAGEMDKLRGEVARLSGKLSNEGFVAKAPAAVVEAERAKLAAAEEKLRATEQALAKLG